MPPAKDVKDGQICDGESDQTDYKKRLKIGTVV